VIVPPVKGRYKGATEAVAAYDELNELEANDDEGDVFSTKSVLAVVGLNQYSTGAPLPVIVTVIPTYLSNVLIDPVASATLAYGPNLESMFLVVLTVKLSITDIAMIRRYVNI
jgi:hypothetical protein